jgi:hypothetical protein
MVGQGQAVELQHEVPGPALITLNPARSTSAAQMELTAGIASADRQWIDPATIQDALVTIASAGWILEHSDSPDVLLAFLLWLALCGAKAQRPS